MKFFLTPFASSSDATIYYTEKKVKWEDGTKVKMPRSVTAPRHVLLVTRRRIELLSTP